MPSDDSLPILQACPPTRRPGSWRRARRRSGASPSSMSRARPGSTRAPCRAPCAGWTASATRPVGGSWRPPTSWSTRRPSSARRWPPGTTRTVGDRAAQPALLVLQRGRLRGERGAQRRRLPDRADQPRHRLRLPADRLRAVRPAVPPARRGSLPRRPAVRRHSPACRTPIDGQGAGAGGRPRWSAGRPPRACFVDHREGGRLVAAAPRSASGHTSFAMVEGQMSGKTGREHLGAARRGVPGRIWPRPGIDPAAVRGCGPATATPPTASGSDGSCSASSRTPARGGLLPVGRAGVRADRQPCAGPVCSARGTSRWPASTIIRCRGCGI